MMCRLEESRDVRSKTTLLLSDGQIAQVSRQRQAAILPSRRYDTSAHNISNIFTIPSSYSGTTGKTDSTASTTSEQRGPRLRIKGKCLLKT